MSYLRHFQSRIEYMLNLSSRKYVKNLSFLTLNFTYFQMIAHHVTIYFNTSYVETLPCIISLYDSICMETDGIVPVAPVGTIYEMKSMNLLFKYNPPNAISRNENKKVYSVVDMYSIPT